MDIKFEFKKIGGSIVIILPSLFAKNMNIEEKDEGIMRFETRKDNKNFISVWKKGE